MKKLFLFSFILISLNAFSQAELAKYKAMFSLNFIRYIGWPDAAKQGDFVVGVLNDAQISGQLKEQTAGKTFYNQNITVKEFKNPEDISYCQLLYVSDRNNFSKNVALIKQKLGSKNSLIITEKEGAIEDGSMINFVIRDGKLKFEISSKNAESFGLKFSS